MKRNFTITSCLLLLTLLAFNNIQAQISFTNQNVLLSNSDFHSGVAIGIADVNNDGLDDIVRLNEAMFLQVELQNEDGTFTNKYIDNVGNDEQWMVIVGDVDNDGFNDIVTGGRYDDIKVFTYNSENDSYDFAEMPGNTLFAQGANLNDINNDGWLDIFVCHDDAESRIWANDGAGNFLEADEWIDMTTTPASDNSGNYGSVWTDIDNDGDRDLYIAKCRQGVNNSSDPRRINQLFINDGNNNFTEQAEEYGLKIGAQSWTADFGDYDNDGDMDCFITNHDANSQLLENDGNGYFSDVTTQSGIVVGGLPIQGIFRDFDNDGRLDIIVSGTEEYLWYNNGDGTFTELDDPFPGGSTMESYAVGDLNEDGFLDIYAGYAQVFNNPTNTDDVIWMNEGNDNNFLCIKATGVISNKAAVGARVEIYGDFGVQIREIRAGESYGISNSLKAHFGLGTHESVDLVIVRFPSGITNIIENPTINQTLEIIEDGCIAEDVTIDYTGEIVLCEGESILLTASEASEYLWSNGATTPSIEVTEAGEYFVYITNAEGCIGNSSSVSVTFNPDNTPTVFIATPTNVCEGETVSLTASESNSYLWSTGETTQTIEVTEAGNYNVTVPGYCQDFTSGDVGSDFNFFVPDAIEGVNDTIYEPGNAILFLPGQNVTWYDVPSGGEPVGLGAFFETPYIATTTPYYAEKLQDFAGANFQVGIPEHSGSSLFGGNQFNGELIFDAFEAFILKTVRVYTDTPGDRIIEIRDADDNVLDNVTVNIPVGEHIIEVDLNVPVGTNLVLGTNTASNNANFGYNSARLQRNNTNTNYPYTIEDFVSIKESGFGTDWYYYFYDWQIEKVPVQCLSDRVEVLAVLETSSLGNIQNAEKLVLKPNPTSQSVFFELPIDVTNTATIGVFDISGKEIFQEEIDATSRQELDLAPYAAGMYLIKIRAENRVFVGKVMKN